MPSAQRGPARSNMAVGAGGYIKRAKANSVFSCASGGSGKSLYSIAGYSRNGRWKAHKDPTSSGTAPASSHRLPRSSAIKKPPGFLAQVNRQGAAQHSPLELPMRHGPGGIARQKIGQDSVAAGRPDNAVDPRRVRQQQLLQPDAMRQFVADLPFPGSLVAAQLAAREAAGAHRIDSSTGRQFTADHRVVD